MDPDYETLYGRMAILVFLLSITVVGLLTCLAAQVIHKKFCRVKRNVNLEQNSEHRENAPLNRDANEEVSPSAPDITLLQEQATSSFGARSVYGSAEAAMLPTYSEVVDGYYE